VTALYNWSDDFLPLLTIDKKLSYRRCIARQQALRRWRLFKVADFGASERVCHFPSEFYLHPPSYRFKVIADYSSIFRFRHWVPLFIALARDELPQTHDYNIWHNETRNIALLYSLKIFRYFEPFRRRSRVLRAVGRADAQSRLKQLDARWNYWKLRKPDKIEEFWKRVWLVSARSVATEDGNRPVSQLYVTWR